MELVTKHETGGNDCKCLSTCNAYFCFKRYEITLICQCIDFEMTFIFLEICNMFVHNTMFPLYNILGQWKIITHKFRGFMLIYVYYNIYIKLE